MQMNIYFGKNLHQVAGPGSQHAEIGLIGQLAAYNRQICRTGYTLNIPRRI